MADAPRPPVLAVLGKGGVGKTVISTLLARALCDTGQTPLLLIDADPALGLSGATGLPVRTSLAELADGLLADASAPDADRQGLAEQVDYRLLEALTEGRDLALLAMGISAEGGCFCPLNRLLRLALDRLSAGFRCVVVDAEAGLEQVQRQVFERIDLALIACDGSLRSAQTAERLASMLQRGAGPGAIGVALNRCPAASASLPDGLPLWLQIPEDAAVRLRDRRGEALLGLSAGSEALSAVLDFVRAGELAKRLI